MVLNLAGSTGWRGWGGQLLFHDFVIFYGAGALFHHAPESLYDFTEQLSLQRSLIAPTLLEGTGPFAHPPYVAPLLEMLTGLSLPLALIAWTALSGAALVGAAALARRLLQKHPWNIVVPTRTFTLIALSLAPVLFGLYSGQMHAFVLLGSLAVVKLALEDKPWHAGAIAGLLAIKPQVGLSFLIFFLVRLDFRACTAAALSFGGLNALFIGTVGWTTAVSLYASYLETTRSLVTLPFVDGFPRYLLLTPYGLMSGVVGPDRQGMVLLISSLLAVAALVWFLRDAWTWRRSAENATHLLLGRTLLLPSLVTPYLMMYDSAPLVVACVLLVQPTMPHRALTLAVMVYAGLWIYPPLSAAIGVPLGALVPMGLWIAAATERPAG
jgi:hypothetical protein